MGLWPMYRYIWAVPDNYLGYSIYPRLSIGTWRLLGPGLKILRWLKDP